VAAKLYPAGAGHAKFNGLDQGKSPGVVALHLKIMVAVNYDARHFVGKSQSTDVLNAI